MFSKRKVKQIKKKIMETLTMCGTVEIHSKEELAWLYNEKDLYTFFYVLNNSDRACAVERPDGTLLIDWIPF